MLKDLFLPSDDKQRQAYIDAKDSAACRNSAVTDVKRQPCGVNEHVQNPLHTLCRLYLVPFLAERLSVVRFYQYVVQPLMEGLS